MEYTHDRRPKLISPRKKNTPGKKSRGPVAEAGICSFGTLITSDLGIAYLEDKKGAPVTTPGRGKRQTAVKKGESLSGFILKELFNDRVVMNRGEETMTVYLNDSQTPKAREAVPDLIKTAPKTATAGTPPAPSRPGTSPAARQARTRPRPTAPQTAPSTAGTNTPGSDKWSSLAGDPRLAVPGGPGGLYPLKAPIPAGALGGRIRRPSPSPVRPYP